MEQGPSLDIRIDREDGKISRVFRIYVGDQEVGKADLYSRDVPNQHWRLENIAVPESDQQKGYGSKLMDEIEAYIVKSGLPAVLENGIWGEHVDFYEKRGWVYTGFEDEMVFNMQGKPFSYIQNIGIVGEPDYE